MPKMGPGGGKRKGGGRSLSSAFNAMANPFGSNAFASSAFDSDAFTGDDHTPRSQPSMAGSNPWGGR